MLTNTHMNAAGASLFNIASSWLEQGKALALATVIKTWGSSPCPAGSMLIVDTQANFQGSVSGGCVESAVIAMAIDCIATGKSEKMQFAVSHDQAWDVGLACGGEIQIYVEPLQAEHNSGINQSLLEKINRIASAQESFVLIKNITNNTATSWTPDPTSQADDALTNLCQKALESDNCQYLEESGEQLFIQPLNPPLRMIIIGAVHIAQTLASLAQSCAYAVTVVDPRPAFATESRFPQVTINRDWPDKAMQDLTPDNRTAVVTLTHDPKLDEPALAIALDSDAFYIGALGSRKTHASRVASLTERGLSTALLDKIHAPIGLGIAAQSPAEIAVAIMAEVTQTLRAQ